MLTFLNIFLNIVFNFFSNPIYLSIFILLSTISINFVTKYTYSYDTKSNNLIIDYYDNDTDVDDYDTDVDDYNSDDIDLDDSDVDSDVDFDVDSEFDSDVDSEFDDSVNNKETNDKQVNDKESDDFNDLEIIEAIDYSKEIDLRSSNPVK